MIPVSVLSSIDPVLRAVTAFTAVVDHPGTVVVLQDLDPGAGTLRRVTSDVTGVIEDETVALQHVCLGCAIREDSLPYLELIAGSGRWEQVLWGLPVSAEAAPLTTAIDTFGDAMGVRMASLLSVADVDSVVHDVFGDALLVEDHLALADDDRRSVGEALVAQLRHADLVLCHAGASPVTGTAGDIGHALIDHLRGPGSIAVPADQPTDLFAARYHASVTEDRLDPLKITRSLTPDTDDGVWSLELHSARPFHPQRLLEAIEVLGSTDLCSRGRFALPGRPGAVHCWDGAGGQLSIGDTGTRVERCTTRLVYTGIGSPQRKALLSRTFRDTLMTDRELRTVNRWHGIDDGFDPWLGEFQISA
ncbi:MAG: GTP-binding protein [Nakamurella sp.]